MSLGRSYQDSFTHSQTVARDLAHMLPPAVNILSPSIIQEIHFLLASLSGGGGGGGGGQKVPTLISKIHIFASNTALAVTFGNFSQNLSRKMMVC